MTMDAVVLVPVSVAMRDEKLRGIDYHAATLADMLFFHTPITASMVQSQGKRWLFTFFCGIEL